MDILTLISTILGSNVLVVLVTHYFTKQKINAESKSINADAMSKAIAGSVEWAESMRKDIDELRDSYNDLSDKYEAVLTENHKLRSELTVLQGLYNNAKSNTPTIQ